MAVGIGYKIQVWLAEAYGDGGLLLTRSALG